MNVPATAELAFSCVPLKAVPYAIGAGADQLIVGVTLFTVSDTVLVALL